MLCLNGLWNARCSSVTQTEADKYYSIGVSGKEEDAELQLGVVSGRRFSTSLFSFLGNSDGELLNEQLSQGTKQNIFVDRHFQPNAGCKN